MFVPPKLLVIVLIIFAGWYVMRWWNRHIANPSAAARRPQPQRRAGAAPRAVEDLAACRLCGTYVASGARACGKPGCPQPL